MPLDSQVQGDAGLPNVENIAPLYRHSPSNSRVPSVARRRPARPAARVVHGFLALSGALEAARRAIARPGASYLHDRMYPDAMTNLPFSNCSRPSRPRARWPCCLRCSSAQLIPTSSAAKRRYR